MRADTIPLPGRDDLVAETVDRLKIRDSRLMLAGEPGVGKTTVWLAAIARCDADWVWTSACLETEADLGLAVLADLFDAVPEAVASRLPRVQRRARDAILYRDVPEAHESAPEGADRLLAVTTLSLLRELAGSGSVLLGIDDAQWCDPGSFRALSYALRRARDLPIALLTTCRSGSSREFDASERVMIDPLPDRAIAELVEAVAAEHAYSLPEARRDEIVRLSAGNAFFARELVAHAIARPNDVRAPSSVRDAVARRVRAVPRRLRPFVLDVAVRGVVRRDELGPRVAGPDVRELTADLLTIDQDGARIAHPLLAAGVLEAASPAQLRDAHRRAAGAVVDPVAAALHRMCCESPNESLAADMDSAGRLAWVRGDVQGTHTLARLALEATPEGARPLTRLRRLADLERVVGNADTSAELAREMLIRASVPSERATALIILANAVSDDRTALDALHSAAEISGLTHAERNAVLRKMVNRLFRAGKIDEAMRLLEDVLRRMSEDADGWAGLVGFAALLRRISGHPHDAALLERALAVEHSVEMVAGADGEALAHTSAGTIALFDDRHVSATELLTTAAEFAAQRGTYSVGTYYLAVLDIRTGKLRRAADRLEAAIALDGPNALGHARLSLAYAWLGDPECAARAAARSRSLVVSETDRALAELHFAEGFGYLIRRQYRDAYASLRAAAAVLEAIGYREPSHPAVLPVAVEAACAVGEIEQARQWCDRLEDDAARVDSRFGAAAALRARGFVAQASADPTSACTAFEESAEHFADLAVPLEAARSYLALGQQQRRGNQRRNARQSLERAHAIFADCRAEGLRRDAEVELRAISGRRPENPHALTPAEARVATLAAAGRRNADIARELSLSEKTVETHLGHAYRKLAVTNRTALAHAIDTSSTTDVG